MLCGRSIAIVRVFIDTLISLWGLSSAAKFLYFCNQRQVPSRMTPNFCNLEPRPFACNLPVGFVSKRLNGLKAIARYALKTRALLLLRLVRRFLRLALLSGLLLFVRVDLQKRASYTHCKTKKSKPLCC